MLEKGGREIPAAQTKVGFRGMAAWYMPTGLNCPLPPLAAITPISKYLVKVYINIKMVSGHKKGSLTYLANPDGDPSYSVL